MPREMSRGGSLAGALWQMRRDGAGYCDVELHALAPAPAQGGARPDSDPPAVQPLHHAVLAAAAPELARQASHAGHAAVAGGRVAVSVDVTPAALASLLPFLYEQPGGGGPCAALLAAARRLPLAPVVCSRVCAAVARRLGPLECLDVWALLAGDTAPPGPAPAPAQAGAGAFAALGRRAEQLCAHNFAAIAPDMASLPAPLLLRLLRRPDLQLTPATRGAGGGDGPQAGAPALAALLRSVLEARLPAADADAVLRAAPVHALSPAEVAGLAGHPCIAGHPERLCVLRQAAEPPGPRRPGRARASRCLPVPGVRRRLPRLPPPGRAAMTGAPVRRGSEAGAGGTAASLVPTPAHRSVACQTSDREAASPPSPAPASRRAGAAGGVRTSADLFTASAEDLASFYQSFDRGSGMTAERQPAMDSPFSDRTESESADSPPVAGGGAAHAQRSPGTEGPWAEHASGQEASNSADEEVFADFVSAPLTMWRLDGSVTRCGLERSHAAAGVQVWDEGGLGGVLPPDPPAIFPGAVDPTPPGKVVGQGGGSWEGRPGSPDLQPSLVVVGGQGMSGTGRSVQMHRPNTRAWVNLADCILPRSLFGSAVWGNNLFVFGGNEAYGSGERYDPVADEWTTIAPSHAAVPGCSTATVGDIIFVNGGQGKDGLSGLSSYSPIGNFWQQEPSPGHPRAFHTMLAHGQSLIVVGGMGADEEVLASVEAYDTVTEAWSAMPPLPAPRMCHAALLDEARSWLYVIGGVDEAGQALASVLRMCLSDGAPAWEAVTPMPHPRQSMAAVFFAGHPCVLGGWAPDVHILDSDCVLMYDAGAEVWTYSNPDSLRADQEKARRRRRPSTDGRTSTREQLLFSSLGVREELGAAVLMCPRAVPPAELMSAMEEFEGDYGAMTLPSGAKHVLHGVQRARDVEGVSIPALAAQKLTPDSESRVR